MSKNALSWTVFGGLFFIPFIPFLLSSSLFFPFITTKAFFWRVVIEIVFAAWLLLALSFEEYHPKKSSLLFAFGAFVVAVTLADLLGVDPMRSIWSNFERMEGLISIFHLFGFFLVISSAFNEVHWNRWWNATLLASALMVVYSFFQVMGVTRVSQSDARVDGTLGNAIYLAVYLLFHIFIALLMLYRNWKNKSLRWVYGLLILSQVFILYFTATRGTILGLLGGLSIFALLNLRNRENKIARKGSFAIFALLVILVGGFFFVRETQFVKSSPVLSRFSTLNFSEIKTQGRYYIWPMALQGIADRPILGWGQDNFNYVFQKYYRPEMHRLEPWFDRAHNVFLDWAIAGGLVGLLLYLSLYFLSLKLIWRDNLSYLEKSILTALLAAYFFHNIFVFDNLISYIFFATLLAYVHQRGGAVPLWKGEVSKQMTNNIVLPALSVALIFVLYFVNLKPLFGNLALINALKTSQTGQALLASEHFKTAYESSELGQVETIQQILGYWRNILSSDKLTIDQKNEFFNFSKDAILRETASAPNDIKLLLVAGAFLSGTGFSDEALKHLERARELSPNKQQIHLEIAQAYYAKGDTAKAVEAFQEIIKLSPELSDEVNHYIKQIQNQN